MGTTLLEFSSVTKEYGASSTAVRALAGVSATVEAGEFVVLTGPSGSGKSTLIHLAAGLESPTQGRVLLDDRDLSALSDDELSALRCGPIGLVFQAFHLVDYLTAEQNVALPLRFGGAATSEAGERARAALAAVGLSGRVHHRPGELSGGEMQRVAVARALVGKPRLLLADEPTGNLDSAAGAEVLDLLHVLARKEQVAVLLATHDQDAAAAAPRVLTLRDGAVLCDSTH